MHWIQEWRAIEAEILGLGELMEYGFHGKSMDGPSFSPQVGVSAGIHDLATTIEKQLQQLKDGHGHTMPHSITNALEKFLSRLKKVINFREPVAGIAPSLIALRVTINYHLEDKAAYTRKLVERALVHLQCSITADPVLQRAWRTAFSKNEPGCEKLGAAHLMLHGIWSFKASSKGERTDLVLCPAGIQAPDAAEGMVLTEWKLSKMNGKSPAEAAEEGLTQARRYSDGIFAGFVLRSDRYIIVVGDDIGLDALPKPRLIDGVTYHFRGVSVERDTPSEESKKKRRKTA